MFGTKGTCSLRQTKNIKEDVVGVMPVVTLDGVFTPHTANRYSQIFGLFVCLFVLLINNSYILRVSFDLV